jgi:predicted nucleotidyltransferase
MTRPVRHLAETARQGYNDAMQGVSLSRDDIIAVLRSHRAELQAHGIEGMTLFGSVARDEAGPESDIDLAARLSASFSAGGFDYFGKLEQTRNRLAALLGCAVDLVEEPAIRPTLRRAIERDGVRAF